MDHLRDLRLTVRHLIQRPGYASATIVILALAIGATSGIFSAVYAILLKPLPISDPERLVICWGTDSSREHAVVELSYRHFQDWRAESRSFADVAAMGSSNWTMVLDGRGEPVSHVGWSSSPLSSAASALSATRARPTCSMH